MEQLKFPSRIELPPELLYKIVSRCTRTELLMFTLVDKACKHEAEKYLYQNIRICPPTRKCLNVLSQNSRKALLVRSFSLSRSPKKSFSEDEVELLCQALLLMKNIQDISLWVMPGHADAVSVALLQNSFQLHTMCIPRSFQNNIQLLSHPPLHSLAFYGGPDEITMDELALYENLAKSSLNQKQFLIYLLTQTHLDTLIVFPVFYRMRDVIAKLEFSVSKITSVSHIDTLHIYFHDISDELIMYDTFSSLAASFPEIKYLVILIRSLSIHIGTGTMSPYLAMLPRLLVLKIRLWESDVSSLDSGVYHGRTTTIAGVWAAACPTLRWVEFPNGQVLVCRSKPRVWDELYSDDE